MRKCHNLLNNYGDNSNKLRDRNNKYKGWVERRSRHKESACKSSSNKNSNKC